MQNGMKLFREKDYYTIVLGRLIDEMDNEFYGLHKTQLDSLSFLIGAHKQDSEHGREDTKTA